MCVCVFFLTFFSKVTCVCSVILKAWSTVQIWSASQQPRAGQTLSKCYPAANISNSKSVPNKLSQRDKFSNEFISLFGSTSTNFAQLYTQNTISNRRYTQFFPWRSLVYLELRKKKFRWFTKGVLSLVTSLQKTLNFSNGPVRARPSDQQADETLLNSRRSSQQRRRQGRAAGLVLTQSGARITTFSPSDDVTLCCHDVSVGSV